MTRTTCIKQQARKFIAEFFHYAYPGKPVGHQVNIPRGDGIHVQFQRYWFDRRDKHKAECKECPTDQDCELIDVLQLLHPDPVTGISNEFRDHLTRIAHYPFMDGPGFIFIPSIADP